LAFHSQFNPDNDGIDSHALSFCANNFTGFLLVRLWNRIGACARSYTAVFLGLPGSEITIASAGH
jgi:hypothetical protein